MRQPKYWWKEAKIYELYIDKFAGTFKGATEHLDYLQMLGINTLHILPHYPSPMVDDGYDVSDYRGVRPELGTLDDLKEFIKKAHEFGIRIIIDFVFNHTSSQHPWFSEARLDEENPKRDFYIWSDTQEKLPEGPNAFPDIKPSNWIFNPPTKDYYYATFYPEQPDLNWDNEEVFDAMLSNMEFWATIGVDGFRLDAAPFIIKREGTNCMGLPETHATLKRMRARLQKSFPEAILIAEVHQTLAETKKYFGGGDLSRRSEAKGDECHMIYHFGLMEQMWLALLRGNVDGMKEILEESADIPENCQWAIFLRNHDEISTSTLSQEDRSYLLAQMDPESRYLMKKMERTSMRIGSIFKDKPAEMRAAFEMLYGSPGAPIMYYGDELGMLNSALEDGVIDTRKYVRGMLDWDIARAQMQDPASLYNAVARIVKKVSAEIVHAEDIPAEQEALETIAEKKLNAPSGQGVR